SHASRRSPQRSMLCLPQAPLHSSPRPRLAPISPLFSHDTAAPELYTLSLHDALPISARGSARAAVLLHVGLLLGRRVGRAVARRSEEHTSELQSLTNLVCRLLLETKNHRLRSATYASRRAVTIIVLAHAASVESVVEI